MKLLLETTLGGYSNLSTSTRRNSGALAYKFRSLNQGRLPQFSKARLFYPSRPNILPLLVHRRRRFNLPDRGNHCPDHCRIWTTEMLYRWWNLHRELIFHLFHRSTWMSSNPFREMLEKSSRGSIGIGLPLLLHLVLRKLSSLHLARLQLHYHQKD